MNGGAGSKKGESIDSQYIIHESLYAISKDPLYLLNSISVPIISPTCKFYTIEQFANRRPSILQILSCLLLRKILGHDSTRLPFKTCVLTTSSTSSFTCAYKENSLNLHGTLTLNKSQFFLLAHALVY